VPDRRDGPPERRAAELLADARAGDARGRSRERGVPLSASTPVLNVAPSTVPISVNAAKSSKFTVVVVTVAA
jgi:hypothetical protein